MVLFWHTGVAACFIVGYVVLTLLRFGLLAAAGIGPGDILPALQFRFGSTSYNGGFMVTLGDFADELWRACSIDTRWSGADNVGADYVSGVLDLRGSCIAGCTVRWPR
jgi:hypothetical protein